MLSSESEENNTVSEVDEIVIDEDIKKETDQTIKNIGMDIENNSDLQSIDEEYEPSKEEIEQTLNDKSIPKLKKEKGEAPRPEDTLSKESVEKINNEAKKKTIDEIKKEKQLERERLVIEAAGHPSIKLHLQTGEKDGKTIWVEKAYFFKAPTMRQVANIQMELARINDLEWRWNKLMTMKMEQLNKGDFEFLRKARMYITCLNYNIQKKEAKMRLGISDEEFSRISEDEYKFAVEVVLYKGRTAGPFRSRGQ